MKKIAIILIALLLAGPIFTQVNKVEQPIQNFEKLWSVFNLKYANFELKGVDWQEVYQKYRPLIHANMTNGELFEVSCSMLQELRDGHVTIEPNFEEEIECGPPYEFQLEVEFPTDIEQRQLAFAINTTLSRNGFLQPQRHELSEDTNFEYRLSESFGYLRLDEMTEKLTFGKFRKTVDEAVAKFQNKKGLIIDLRFNGGGWDRNAYKLASRLLPPGEEAGHFVRTKKREKNEFSKKKYKRVNSGGKYQFTGPIVILTSDYTASAAEVFIMLLNDLPNVTLIGDRTEGIFSDMHEFRLPNKWEVSLSHQQFFSEAMVNYEGKGIVPDIQVLNRRNDVMDQRDIVIECALQYLLGKEVTPSN